MATRRKPLTVVKPGDMPAEPASLIEAIDSTERAVLVMARRILAKTIDGGPPAHTLATMARQLLEVDAKIRALDSLSGEHDDVGKAAATPDEAWDETAL